jgi:hypothetical protein
MKRIILLAFLFISLIARSQSIKLKSETIRVKSENAEGFEVDLEGAADDVEVQFTKYLKPIGKTKKTENVIAISLPSINGKTYTSPLYASVKSDGSAWIGIIPAEWSSNAEGVKKDLEKLMYDFGVTYNREKVQRQIDESTQALMAVEKQQQRLLNQNKDLNTGLTNNRLEKSKLEKGLEDNKIELETLTKKLEQNVKDQDSLRIVNEKIKKVIDMQKEKQRRVN